MPDRETDDYKTKLLKAVHIFLPLLVGLIPKLGPWRAEEALALYWIDDVCFLLWQVAAVLFVSKLKLLKDVAISLVGSVNLQYLVWSGFAIFTTVIKERPTPGLIIGGALFFLLRGANITRRCYTPETDTSPGDRPGLGQDFYGKALFFMAWQVWGYVACLELMFLGPRPQVALGLLSLWKLFVPDYNILVLNSNTLARR